MIRRSLSAIALALAAPAAGAPQLVLPVDCTLGDSCYIQQFMDHDPGEGFQDFTCGPRAYNTHKGTDFAVPTAADAKRGVRVLAAADGTVLGVRDGMPDTWDGKIDAESIAGRDCGNGLVLDHGEGWQTQYCHMREGSVNVAKGDQVKAGQVLGMIGMSGRTEFAHMHLSVRKDGVPVDPFAPEGADCDAPPARDLWQQTPLIQPGGLLALGFAESVPDYAAIKMGEAEQNLTRISPAIVSYGYAFGGRQGDVFEMHLSGPGDFEVQERFELPRNLALFYRAIGKKRRSAPWPGGDYVANARLLRNGAVISARSASFTIPR